MEEVLNHGICEQAYDNNEEMRLRAKRNSSLEVQASVEEKAPDKVSGLFTHFS